MNNKQLKKKVYTYWNTESCGTNFAHGQKFSYNYFEQIEQHRYAHESDIFSFAQFTRFHGKKILEVGVGAGTDFIQFVRAGTQAYGIDLTQEAIDHVKQRLALYNLQAKEVRVADAESLPYENNSFDLVYSWGVIHHSPDPQKCLSEIIRVTKPQGIIKIMVYNRHSLYAWHQYFKHGLLKGHPLRSIKDILFHHQESIGTQAFSQKEMHQLLSDYSLENITINTWMQKEDFFCYRYAFVRTIIYIFACILGLRNTGWYMKIECVKSR